MEFVQYSKWKYDHIVAGTLLGAVILFFICVSVGQGSLPNGKE